MENKMISLIMATLGRKIEVENMLESLLCQTYKNFEVIIVDQNRPEFLNEIIKKYSNKLKIKHINITEKGLSRARNIGLKYIEGEYIGFPDDDCIYQNDTLKTLVEIFKDNNIDVVTGSIVRDLKKTTGNDIKKVNIYDVWLKGISYTMFFKKNVIKKIGDFDEVLGVGSGTIYGSGEETDFLIRAIENNFLVWNTNKIMIYHPDENFNNEKITQKAYFYSKGRMYVLKKHKYNSIFIFINKIYPLIKIIRYFYCKKKVKFYWSQFLGRI
ncbi:MAG: glycosyltransferase family A protein [Megamonas funiformis]|uniref:glycosyltransferase family 2 protein n=1 Tax=Megamonas funiformis TaxID=437897 RepID=UPI002A8304DF|nr:glycosyltransferase family A protein [Megamonas funiformis]MDY3874181.1 glycosyltransferase family A protein [Megamonas funiformis]